MSAPLPPPPSYSGPGASAYVPDHPKATTAMVLGILSLVVCLVLGPVALVLGRSAMTEIDASGGTLGGRGAAKAGYILGIIATSLLALLFVILVVVLVVALATSS